MYKTFISYSAKEIMKQLNDWIWDRIFLGLFIEKIETDAYDCFSLGILRVVTVHYRWGK